MGCGGFSEGRVIKVLQGILYRGLLYLKKLGDLFDFRSCVW